MLRITCFTVFALCLFVLHNSGYSRQHVFFVDTLTTLVDANYAPFNQVQPGDTVSFKPGKRAYILIRNFTGENDKPVVFINGPGPGRDVALRVLRAQGIKVAMIADLTPMPHNGTRPRKARH